MATDTDVHDVIAESVPLIEKLATGRYAISIGGSRGKGTADQRSDIDFRLFCDEEAPESEQRSEAKRAFDEVMTRWRERGVEIDGCWIRTIATIDRELDDWLGGKLAPVPKVWTVWGYYLLPDIYHQQVIEDPDGVIAGWKERLSPYPRALKQAVLDKHLGSLRYWRDDYHYANKVRREDAIFLAGLSARLVHDMVQVIFALNETYFPGDGSNTHFMERFALLPDHFDERIRAALYPAPGDGDGDADRPYERQRALLIGLINDVTALVQGSSL